MYLIKNIRRQQQENATTANRPITQQSTRKLLSSSLVPFFVIYSYSYFLEDGSKEKIETKRNLSLLYLMQYEL